MAESSFATDFSSRQRSQIFLIDKSNEIDEKKVTITPSLVEIKPRHHPKPKTRKSISKGRWSYDEHQRFISGVIAYGNEWKKVGKIIKTRSSTQARSHAQKFFIKLKKSNCNIQSGLHIKALFNQMKNSPEDHQAFLDKLLKIPFDNEHYPMDCSYRIKKKLNKIKHNTQSRPKEEDQIINYPKNNLIETNNISSSKRLFKVDKPVNSVIKEKALKTNIHFTENHSSLISRADDDLSYYQTMPMSDYRNDMMGINKNNMLRYNYDYDYHGHSSFNHGKMPYYHINYKMYSQWDHLMITYLNDSLLQKVNKPYAYLKSIPPWL